MTEFNRCQVPRLSALVGEDQLLADNKVKKLNNNCQPSKRRKVDHDVDEVLMEDETKKVHSDTIDNTETSQNAIDGLTVDVVSHDEGDLKLFQPLNPKKKRKPNPTKTIQNINARGHSVIK